MASCRDRLQALSAAVGRPTDLSLYQWAELFTMAADFQPDLILELGRGEGNSTCVFTEAANRIGSDRCKVVSLCLTESWEKRRPEAIAKVVPPEWFAPLKTHSGNMLEFDFKSLLAGPSRVLVFWDAHGYDIAELVLGEILPLLANRKHLILMHDLSDARYSGPEGGSYGGQRLWRGNDWSGPRVRLGNIDSAVGQAVAIVDFTSRNKVTLHSADESIRTELWSDPKKIEELRELLGSDFVSEQAHWFWFTLNESTGPFTFPRFVPPEPVPPEPVPESAPQSVPQPQR
ncbi:MAG: hypothetical protein WD648_11910 [Planctomycetaceae bacterium]